MYILAGQYKGRRLLSPPKGSSTRPITGLAKKSLFDMLGPWLAGASVADLYCGTGTMGLEALSRGADRCWFAERDRGVLGCLRQNIELLGAADRCVIWQGDVPRRLAEWLAELSRPLDLAFVDPPYEHVRQWDWRAAQETIFSPLASRLAGEGLVALRMPADAGLPAELGGLAVQRTRTYGDMLVALLGRPSGRAVGSE